MYRMYPSADYQDRINGQIEDTANELYSNGVGELSRDVLITILKRLAEYAFTEGLNYRISSLITTDQLEHLFSISSRRARAIAKSRHEAYGIGFKIPGAAQWFFLPEDVKLLAPERPGRRWEKK
jgi:hypothetical protein